MAGPLRIGFSGALYHLTAREGVGQDLWQGLRQQIDFGDEAFGGK